MAQETRPGVFITEQEFAQLDNIIGNIPSRHGIAVIDFFRAVQHKRNLEAQQAAAQQESKPASEGAPIGASEIKEPGVGEAVVE